MHSENSTSRNIVSVVVPALNEESGITKTISEIPREELEKMDYECEILVVDGGSKDRTKEIASENGAKVIVEPRLGYGIAYKTGFAHARGNIIVSLDGDFSYPGFMIPSFVKLLDERELDFISANRMNSFADGSFSFLHLAGNKILTHLANILFGVNIKDSQSGMWVFRKSMLNKLTLLANGMPFSEEIKILAFKLFRSTEISIPYRKRMGKQKLRTLVDGLKNLAHLFVLRMSLSSLSLSEEQL